MKKILNSLVIFILLITLTGCNEKETKKEPDKALDNVYSNEKNTNYKFGDKVSVQLNNKENEIGNIIKDDGTEVQILLETVSTYLEYNDLENHKDAKKQSWTNVDEVNLLNVEYIFDKCLELFMNDTMDAYGCHMEEKDMFLTGTATYWVSGDKSHDLHCHAGDGSMNNCSWDVVQGRLALIDKSYIKSGFRPVVTISKEYVSKYIKSNKSYELYDIVYLKNDSKWLVLEDLGEEVLLIKTKKNGLVEASGIKSKIVEEENEIKKSLEYINGTLSNIKVRIPTSKDLEKYFNLDFTKEKDGRVYGISLNQDTHNATKDWEWSSFWVQKDNDYITCKTSNGQMFCSMDEIRPEEEWHNLFILQVNKSNIQ